MQPLKVASGRQHMVRSDELRDWAFPSLSGEPRMQREEKHLSHAFIPAVTVTVERSAGLREALSCNLLEP